MIVNIKGYSVQVDKDDFDFVLNGGFYPYKNKRGYVYFVRKRGHQYQWLHRLILGVARGVFADHKDGNTLNNSRSNLRIATRSQNAFNSKSHSRSGFKGVTWQASTEKWQAQIKANRKTIYLGCFDDPREANEAYRQAALKYAGEFARW